MSDRIFALVTGTAVNHTRSAVVAKLINWALSKMRIVRLTMEPTNRINHAARRCEFAVVKDIPSGMCLPQPICSALPETCHESGCRGSTSIDAHTTGLCRRAQSMPTPWGAKLWKNRPVSRAPNRLTRIVYVQNRAEITYWPARLWRERLFC